MIQCLGCGVYLIIKFGSRKRCKLAYVLGQPWRGAREEHPTTFKSRRLRVESHNFVGLGWRRIRLYPVVTVRSEILNQLGAGRLILDQHSPGLVLVTEFDHLPLEGRIVQSLSKDIEQVVAAVVDSPGSADAEVVELAAFVGGVPALQRRSETR